MGYGRSVLGVTPLIAAAAAGNTPTSFPMSAINNGSAFRFIATDTRDVAYAWINWASATTPGTVRVRIETDASGKPSGTLYDPNATVDITPTAGWQQCTFATVPTTHLVANATYYVVIYTTVAATGSQTLKEGWAPQAGGYPFVALSATDVSTRTNFVESGNTIPVCTLGLTDGTTTTEETLEFAAFAGASNFGIYGVRAVAMKLVVPTGVTMSVVGVVLEQPLRNGTPDDIRARIFDNTNTLVSGATLILPRNSVLSASGKRIPARFPTAVSIAAGTYRVVVDQSNAGGNSATTNSNNWSFYAASFRSSAVAPSSNILSTSTDTTALGGAGAWVDTATDIPLIGLQLNDISASGGGGTVPTAANVRSGIAVGAGTGTLIVPTAAQVIDTVTFDATTIGTVHLPIVADVRNATAFGPGSASSGTLVSPSAANVETGISFGSASSVAGTLTIPLATQVASGVTYGAGGTERTGTAAGGTIPSAADVRSGTAVGATTGTLAVPIPGDVESGVSTDNTTGTLALPTVGQVQNGVGYGAAGTEFTGTLAGGGTVGVIIHNGMNGGMRG
jgi:hypothetical protein